jgi:hypothetical protein
MKVQNFKSAVAKNGSFAVAEGSALRSGATANVPFVRLAKIVFKKVRGGKNKKFRVGLSVGLLAVPLEYCFYVGQLSKCFVFGFMFKFWSVGRLWNGRPTIGYNVLQPDFRAGLKQPTLNRAQNLS